MNGTASGYADACYAEKICPLHGNFKEFHQLPDFPHPVLLKPSHRSLLEMRERVGWKRMCWYNAYENMQFLQMLFQAYRCMKTDRTHAEENIRKTMQKYAPQISKTGVYSVLGMELQGCKMAERSGFEADSFSRIPAGSAAMPWRKLPFRFWKIRRNPVCIRQMRFAGGLLGTAAGRVEQKRIFLYPRD